MIGFLADTAEADTYFTTRLGSSAYWTSGTEKTAALTTAYNQLLAATQWTLPLPGTSGVADRHKIAQMEQALFLLQMQAGGEMRLILQAQGVIEAGIVKEKYNGKGASCFAPLVLELLYTDKVATAFSIIDINRTDTPRG